MGVDALGRRCGGSRAAPGLRGQAKDAGRRMRRGHRVVIGNHAVTFTRGNQTETLNVERLADHALELPDTL